MHDFKYTQEAIRSFMQAQGFSIRKLAEAADVNPSSIQRVISAKNYNPTQSTIEKICKALSVHPLQLVEYADNLKNKAEKELSNGKEPTSLSPEKLEPSCAHTEDAKKKFVATSSGMEPLIYDGDELFVAPASDARSNDIVIAEKEDDGSEVVVRLLRDGNRLWGKLENQDWPGDRIFRLSFIKWKVVGYKRMF